LQTQNQVHNLNQRFPKIPWNWEGWQPRKPDLLVFLPRFFLSKETRYWLLHRQRVAQLRGLGSTIWLFGMRQSQWASTLRIALR
jgi:hypothetical protein